MDRFFLPSKRQTHHDAPAPSPTPPGLERPSSRMPVLVVLALVLFGIIRSCALIMKALY